MTHVDISGLRPADRDIVTSPIKTLSGKKEKMTYVGIALDSSGSMQPLVTETIGAYNSFVDTLANPPEGAGTYTATLVTFGEGIGYPKLKYANRPLTELAKLSLDTYVPSGNTPMYAGIELLLNHLQLYDRGDAAFLVNIFTDGEENASGITVQNRVIDRIQTLQVKGNWTFTFIGANVDLSRIARETHIPYGNMLRYDATSSGMLNMSVTHDAALQNFMKGRSAGASASTAFYATNASSAPSALSTNSKVDNTEEAPV